mmetsp:Transcript_24692/g.30363  ORF Transcript_24692/g.30363 Transcript_24692/m.30363 type:complete len:151 (-) Transcript_24692:1368-1820(-)
MLSVTSRIIRPNRILQKSQQFRNKSSSSGNTPLNGDAGNLATHVHHKMTTFLSIATPIYFLAPDSLINGAVDKTLGVLLAVNVSAHSWIGLNYVVTDYIPKVSKAMVGPARIASAGIGAVTLLGLGKVALNDKGGLKGTALGLWKKKESN